ncbi:TetR/AcrR family transcriptional regulator [Aliamphritea hakodatensis]|uniref:TetR/AcrR family transcriptional regulator n=1 Tax=Aliamphritea hakodatensis TaxID=2895352 RepID=UPI0022FD4CBD|nr:TetR/AcrR family transcriptional regulator [Aliamphritea hakodatensis]
MPKIVDHDAYREELISRAAEYFSEHGYTAASMRKMGVYLGISKSALYHYFPSKEELFLACTGFVMSRAEEDFVIPGDLPADVKIEKLLNIMRANFGSEITIMVEYMRGRSKDEIANDKAMQVAMNVYERSVAAIVGEEKARETLSKLLGTLLLEYMSGQI